MKLETNSTSTQVGGVTVTTNFGHINPRPGFVSAWDAARFDYGCIAFDNLSRWEQIAAVRQFVGREVQA